MLSLLHNNYLPFGQCTTGYSLLQCQSWLGHEEQCLQMLGLLLDQFPRSRRSPARS